MQDLTGRVAWITGAGTGIGAESARLLAGAGCKVVITGRRREPLEEVARSIEAQGGEVMVEPVDVADQPAVAAVVNRIIDRHSRIDIGVFSAGVNIKDRNWSVLNPEGWDSIIRANLDGAFYCCHAVLPHMREQRDGVIINISSMAARQVSMLNGAPYAASKVGLNFMTHSILIEERNNGIRATTVMPGEVDTPILRNRPVPLTEGDLARILKPEDVANVVLFVAQQPPHVTLNEVCITPTWNRFA